MNRSKTPGLSLIPKLKYEHISLTSYSKMRVDLATQVSCIIRSLDEFSSVSQVLSESVGNGLCFIGGDEVTETVQFVKNFDKFFDCVNVTNLSAGKEQRKPFKQPYYSGTDFRLKV